VAVFVGLGVLLTNHATGRADQIVADFLGAASKPGDSVMLAYGAANVIQESGLTTPYKYSWSLPVRTRDPHLKEFVDILTGPTAPTWLVEIGKFNWWGLDTPEFRQARADDYRIVARVCGHDIYLRDGIRRTLPTAPSC
jgi:hypothetical protein